MKTVKHITIEACTCGRVKWLTYVHNVGLDVGDCMIFGSVDKNPPRTLLMHKKL